MKKLMLCAVLALAAAGGAVCAEKGEKGFRGPRKGAEIGNDPVVRMVTNAKVAEKIGLSEEQREQIKAIDKSNKVELDVLRKQLQEAMERQAGLMKAEKIDEAAVMAEIDKTFEVRKELAKRQMKRVISIKSILTPEQVKKALEAFESRPKRGDKARKGADQKAPVKE